MQSARRAHKPEIHIRPADGSADVIRAMRIALAAMHLEYERQIKFMVKGDDYSRQTKKSPAPFGGRAEVSLGGATLLGIAPASVGEGAHRRILYGEGIRR